MLHTKKLISKIDELKQNKNLNFFFILPIFCHVNFPDMNRREFYNKQLSSFNKIDYYFIDQKNVQNIYLLSPTWHEKNIYFMELYIKFCTLIVFKNHVTMKFLLHFWLWIFLKIGGVAQKVVGLSDLHCRRLKYRWIIISLISISKYSYLVVYMAHS